MFFGCTSLTTAPALPATTLAEDCYERMFYNCSGLTTAPVLPATTLAYGCYDMMFYNCSSLNSITCLATDISAPSCTYGWLSFVAAKGVFSTPSSTSWSSGGDGIPSSWTRISDIMYATPLTFEAKAAGAVVTFSKGMNVTLENPLEYSLNGGDWTTYTDAITLENIGDKVSFRSTNATYATSNSDNHSHFSCSDDCISLFLVSKSILIIKL